MRFLMLSWRDPRNPKSGGAERVTLAYLAALVQRGHQASWFANYFPGAPREESLQGIQIVRGGGFGSSIAAAVKWHRRQKPFDLVIDQHHGIPWYAPWWCSSNCIAYIHEILGPIWDAFYSWPLSAIGRQQERWTHRLYRKIPFWTPSESTRKGLYANRVRQVTVIPNGVDTRPVDALEPKPLQLPLKLAAVSRLAPNKRIDHAIRAVQVLTAHNLKTHLTVIGTGDEEPRLRHLVAALHLTDQVTFQGAVSDEEKNALLRQAHFMVHASMREGWGLNVIEANAMGTPALVYPVAGLVDSTIHDETGIVTPDQTPESIAQAAMALLQSPEKYDSLRSKAWDRSKTFQWEVVLPQACAWLESQASRQNG